jgi:hypothetical protein
MSASESPSEVMRIRSTARTMAVGRPGHRARRRSTMPACRRTAPGRRRNRARSLQRVRPSPGAAPRQREALCRFGTVRCRSVFSAASRRLPEWRRVELPADAPSPGPSSSGSKKHAGAPEKWQARGARAAANSRSPHGERGAAGMCRRAVHQLPSQADFSVFARVAGALAGDAVLIAPVSRQIPCQQGILQGMLTISRIL